MTGRQWMLWCWFSFAWLLLLPCISSELFNSDGRLLQLEYAQQAALQGGTVFAIRGEQSVVILTSSSQKRRSIEEGPFPRKLKEIQESTYFIGSGVLADVELVEKFLFQESLKHEKTFNSRIPLRRLAQKLADVLQARSMEESRPLGLATLLIGELPSSATTNHSLCILEIDPAGAIQDCNVACIGRNSKEILKHWPCDKSPLDLQEDEVIHTAVDCLCKAWTASQDDKNDSDLSLASNRDALEEQLQAIDVYAYSGSKLRLVPASRWKVKKSSQ